MTHLHIEPHTLTTKEMTERLLSGDRAAQDSANRKINGAAFDLVLTRFKSDPLGERTYLDEYLSMVTAFAEVLLDRAAAKAA